MIDVISPCVTFNDHEGSTKSYAYAKEHDEAVGEISFVPFFEDISIEYDPGTTTEVTLHDGSKLFLKKVAEDYNPTDRLSAMRLLHETRQRGEFATGRALRRARQRRLRLPAEPRGLRRSRRCRSTWCVLARMCSTRSWTSTGSWRQIDGQSDDRCRKEQHSCDMWRG